MATKGTQLALGNVVDNLFNLFHPTVAHHHIDSLPSEGKGARQLQRPQCVNLREHGWCCQP
jgi:hypothetical protein